MDFKQKCKNARSIIVLTATLIALLLNIKYDRDIIDSLIILIIVIITFYVIANVAIKLIEKIRLMEPRERIDANKDDEEQDDNETSEQTEDEA